MITQRNMLAAAITAALAACSEMSENSKKIFTEDDLAGDYNCIEQEFSSDLGDSADADAATPFSLALNADRSAVFDDTTTTWSYSDGNLTLEGYPTFDNVTVGANSFTVYTSDGETTECVRGEFVPFAGVVTPEPHIVDPVSYTHLTLPTTPYV